MIHMIVGLEAMLCVSKDVVCVKLCVYVVFSKILCGIDVSEIGR